MFGWMRRKKNDEALVSEEKAKLSALVRGIMDSVQSASELAGQQHFEAFRNYFIVSPEGTLQPRYLRIGLADGSVLDVPAFTIVNPSSYVLKRLDVRMAVVLEPHEIKAAVAHGVAQSAGSRCSYAVRLGHEGAKGAVKLRLTFEAEDNAPEALNRIIEELGRSITPTKAPLERPLWTAGKPRLDISEDTTRVMDRYAPHDLDVAPDASGSVPPEVDGSGI